MTPPPPSSQVGFLYLRYVCDPRKLWNWFKPYMRDEEVGEQARRGEIVLCFLLFAAALRHGGLLLPLLLTTFVPSAPQLPLQVS